MKQNRIIFISVLLAVIFTYSCKKELNVNNPNQPGIEAAQTESGFLSLAQGTTYLNGFNIIKYSDGGLGPTFYTGVIGYHDLMGDIVVSDFANAFMNQVGCPDNIVLDDNTVLVNPNSPPKHKDMLRMLNDFSIQGNNPGYYEWSFMYNLLHAVNRILDMSATIPFSGNADTKMNTIKAWCYWWKGFVYARLGSMYYAGIINDYGGDITNSNPGTNGNYVSHDKLITESNKQLDLAITTLTALSGDADYLAVMSGLIPSDFLVGKGGILSPAMWIRNINTLKARNLLVNKRTNVMTAADWNSILTLVNAGIQSNDYVFTGRSNANGDFMTAVDGSLVAKTMSPTAGGQIYKVSERLIQDYDPADKRLANNFGIGTPFIGGSDRGISFNTRWHMIDGGNGMAGVIVLGTRNVGEYELYMATTYEENELMKAEAMINTNNVEGGLAVLDGLRTLQGAGLAPLVGHNLTAAAANVILKKERRVELAFRGLSFYDARRWGVIYDGRSGCVVVGPDGVTADHPLNVNATINYNYLDYWDVPDNDIAFNPPAAGSDPTTNPN
jgi:starch-binding outer membrane protein, SusD/RagB family